MIKFKEFKNIEELYEVVAQQLYKGKIVGHFSGSSEFGPRALGNRSLLARPFPREMHDIVNERKKREQWRPLAGSILEEYVQEYFDIYKLKDGKYPQIAYYMLLSATVLEDKREVIPAITHVDFSCRPQIVSKESNPRFYLLIDKFREVSGIPVVLNSSYNGPGQPIFESPEDVMESYRNTDLVDIVVMQNFFVWKSDK